MTAKQYLRQVRVLDKQIDSKLEDLQNLRSKVCQVTANYSITPGGPSAGDKMASLIARIVDLEKEIADEIDSYADMKMLIGKAIDVIEPKEYRIILRERYFNGKSWGDIAEIICYSERHTTRLHGYALQSIQLKLS